MDERVSSRLVQGRVEGEGAGREKVEWLLGPLKLEEKRDL